MTSATDTAVADEIVATIAKWVDNEVVRFFSAAGFP